MVTDQQVRRLMKYLQKGESLYKAADKAGMDEKTARKYRDLGKLPSEVKKPHTWLTHADAFEEVWDEVGKQLEINPGLEAKTLFKWLQVENTGCFNDGQLRTFQRRVKNWRATEGPSREVYFPQEHYPGQLCQSDFTHTTNLGVTINGDSFPHLIYHFVLTYSNWETGSICYSESFESLSEGLQKALWELGGVPKEHRTDRLTTAVQKADHPEEFTRRYQGLLDHYGLTGRKIQAGKANENGDVEQAHRRFKQAVDQALMLRGSRDFGSREAYEEFIRKIFKELNSNRQPRFQEELSTLRRLPERRLESYRRYTVRVGPSSTVRVQKNTYSVHSRLIGEKVEVRLFADYLEVWYGQRFIEKIPRLRGESKHRISYRHIIDWLVRKPGAFENYRYRKDLFPSSRFRIAYDSLKNHSPSRGHKDYLAILHLAAKEGESRVEAALHHLLNSDRDITLPAVEALLELDAPPSALNEVFVADIDLSDYDKLLDAVEVSP